MTIFKKQTEIKSFPTLSIVVREGQSYYNNETKKSDDYVNLVAADILCKSDGLSRYNINSVMSYALSNNECPIASYERAIKLNHEVYWINQNPTVIHNGTYEKEVAVQIDYTTIYKFQGKFFRIFETANNNLNLLELTMN